MEATELRIGNLVIRKDLGNQEERIEKIIELGSKATTTGPVNVICEYGSLQPVIITEEWLLKFGFAPYSLQGWFQKEIGQHLSIHINSSMQVCLYAGEYIDGEGALIESIKYVHQLQNLYFTLTGEELTIKETVDAPPKA